MSITELGAVGELLSSIVVLATLIYLAAQVRQTKLTVQSSSWQGGIQSIMDINALLATDSDLLDIFLRGMANPDALDSTEQVRMSFVLANLFHTYHKWYRDHQKGLVDEEARRGEELSMLAMLSQPGGERWWRNFGIPYTPKFRSYVDSRLDKTNRSEASRFDWRDPLS